MNDSMVTNKLTFFRSDQIASEKPPFMQTNRSTRTDKHFYKNHCYLFLKIFKSVKEHNEKLCFVRRLSHISFAATGCSFLTSQYYFFDKIFRSSKNIPLIINEIFVYGGIKIDIKKHKLLLG